MAFGIYTATALLVIFLTVLAFDIMGFFSSKEGFEVEGKTVLITGGSQGMGRGVAKLLSQKGANIVIVARNEKNLAEAFKYISAAAKNPAKQRFNAISADVTKPSENDRILAETTAWNHGQPPDVVWQIAGAAHPGLFLETPLEIQRAQMDINYWGACYLAFSTLKVWTKPASATSSSAGEGSKTEGKRQFIMTSSIACLIGLAGYAPYSPAKAAMRSLADDLHSELNIYNGARRAKDPAIRAQAPEKDISVHLVIPGTISSPGLDNENLHKHAVTHILEEGDVVQSEDEVAAAAVNRLEKGDYLITTQWLADVMRVAALGGSARNSVVVDTVLSWIAGIAYLFVTPDMEGKVFKYGKQHGLKSVHKEKK